jgi:hypothetical protein
MAVAAVELAESYQRQGRVVTALNGDVLVVIVMALVMLINIAHLTLNPITRPQNVAHSLEASRRVSAAGN